MKITSHFIVLRDNNGRQEKSDNDLLKLIVGSDPFESIFLDCLDGSSSFSGSGVVLAIPRQWAAGGIKNGFDVVRYAETLPVSHNHTEPVSQNSWLAVSDGRFLTSVDNRLIYKTMADTSADVMAVNIVPQLKTSYEKVLTTSQNELVGFRLFYKDTTQLTPVPNDWPHYLFIKTGVLNGLLTQGGLPLVFSELLELCNSKSLTVNGANVGGSVLDLAAQADLLELMRHRLGSGAMRSHYQSELSQGKNNGDDISIADSARIFGKTVFGKRVNIAENAIIVGPVIIGNDVKIGSDAVIRSSIIGPGVSVRAGELVEGKVLTNSQNISNGPVRKADCAARGILQDSSQNSFRRWPAFSYARFFKRAIDIVVSAIVLILFLPVVPLILLVIKLTSPGPMFFKDTRQGLHGRAFDCLKFRTMKVGADRMQDRLRVLNQADGPQFMINNDPRMSSVGNFLRETYIDEIPQFFNVLLGQMSIVGPRPSPESENILCPFWRDARLSVRPGVTGLWQVCRTRQPMRDFQEWIHYDIKYVRELSFKLDMLICWRTIKKMAVKFVSQF